MNCSAWKFTPDSVSGKRLMQRCRQLLAENEEAGKMISSGRIAKLEGELSMQKALCEEMKKNQTEMDDFVQELDEDMEGMQSTILFLQQQLKEAKETISNLEAQKPSKDMSNPEEDSEMQEEKASFNSKNDIDRHSNDVKLSDKSYHTNQNLSKSIHSLELQNDDEKTSNDYRDPAAEQKDNVIHIPFEESNKDESEIETSFHDESLEMDQTSIEETSGSPTSLPRGRGKRGTPSKSDKTEQQKGRRSQRTTRGQKRVATNSADDEKSEKEDGISGRPKRTRAIPREEQDI